MGCLVGVLTTTAMVAGCGQGNSATDVLRAGGAPSAPPKHFAVGSGALKMNISPTSGPIGTTVSIHGVACGDPDGLNHAVSFNPDASTPGTLNVRTIDSQLSGQSLDATYTISSDDAALAGDATFYVQCATDLASVQFEIAP
jgi:hypothetical protein